MAIYVVHSHASLTMRRDGPTLLLLPTPREVAESASVALALRPEVDPWHLLDHAIDWAQRFNARLDLCSVIPSLGDTTGYDEFSAHGTQEHTRLRMRTTRWLETLHDDVPAPHRGRALVFEGPTAETLAKQADNYSALMLGRSRRSWLRDLMTPGVVLRVTRSSTTPILVLAGRRPARRKNLPLCAVLSGAEPISWAQTHLPNSRLVKVRVSPKSTHLCQDSAKHSPSPRATHDRPWMPWSAGIAKALLASASREDADLLAVTPAPSGLRSRMRCTETDHLLRNAWLSVLVVPSWRAGDTTEPHLWWPDRPSLPIT